MILVKIPSRERPEQFMRVMRQYVATAHDLRDIHFLFSFDADDTSMWDIGQELATLPIHATIYFGVSRSKVHAINRDIEKITDPWDILLVLSDDMQVVKPGWDAEIREAFRVHYPDGNGMVWYPDGYQKDICTIPLMGRKYYDQRGFVYDPRFTSVFCDDLETHIARKAGKLTFVDVQLFRHAHPANDAQVRPDALHKRNETQAIWDRDKALYNKLKAA